MARFPDLHAQFTGDISLHGLRIRSYTRDITLTGRSGASDSVALDDFPAGVYRLYARAEPLVAAAGEADVAIAIGDTGDPDGMMTATQLDGVASGTILPGDGVETGLGYEADWASDGLDATLTATELGDLTAGQVRVRIVYAEPIEVI